MLPAIKAPPSRGSSRKSISLVTSPSFRVGSPARGVRGLPSLGLPGAATGPDEAPATIPSPQHKTLPDVTPHKALQEATTPHKALQEATSSSCDVFLRPPGSAPLQCCCCLDTIDIQPAGACSSCSEEDVSALPLCAKCLQRHSQPEAFKRLRGHRFQALRAPALEPLAVLGLDTAAAGLCMLHRAEPVRYFCREPHCGVGLCGQCVPAHSGHAFADLAASHGSLRAALLAHVYESSCWPAAAGGAAATVAAAASAPAPRDHPVAEDELLDRLDFNSAARRSLTEELAAASQATAEAFDAAAAALAAALEVRGKGKGRARVLLLGVPHAPSLRYARRPARRPSSPTLQRQGPPR